MHTLEGRHFKPLSVHKWSMSTAGRHCRAGTSVDLSCCWTLAHVLLMSNFFIPQSHHSDNYCPLTLVDLVRVGLSDLVISTLMDTSPWPKSEFCLIHCSSKGSLLLFAKRLAVCTISGFWSPHCENCGWHILMYVYKSISRCMHHSSTVRTVVFSKKIWLPHHQICTNMIDMGINQTVSSIWRCKAWI